MQMSKKCHYPEADVLKGILILLVVVGHFLYPFRRSNPWTRALFYGIYSFHMPAFVFLSGALARRRSELRVLPLIKKIFRFLLYYLLYKLLLYPVECLVYGPAPFRLLTESGAPWYLLSLSCWYLLIPLFLLLCRRLPGKRGALSLILLTILTGLAAGYSTFSEYFLCWQRTIAFLPFFALGWCIGAARLFGPESIFMQMSAGSRCLLCGASLLVLLSSGLLSLCIPDSLMHVLYGMSYAVYREIIPAGAFLFLAFLPRLIWYALAGLMTLGLCAFVVVLESRRVRTEGRQDTAAETILPPRLISRLLIFLGQHSLPIYILHRPIRDLWMYYFLIYAIVSSSK